MRNVETTFTQHAEEAKRSDDVQVQVDQLAPKIGTSNLLGGRPILHIKCDSKQTMLVQSIVEKSKEVVEQSITPGSQLVAC
jgi:phage terminase large subunit GpA-like protein